MTADAGVCAVCEDPGGFVYEVSDIEKKRGAEPEGEICLCRRHASLFGRGWAALRMVGVEGVAVG